MNDTPHTDAEKTTIRCRSAVVEAVADPAFTRHDKVFALQDRLRAEIESAGTKKETNAYYATAITCMLMHAGIDIEHPVFEAVIKVLRVEDALASLI